ncbi:MAG: helix-turn-helix domain-containing protein [Candidatus Paceibacterota bacterium]
MITETKIIKTISDLGLSKTEAKVYLSVLELGEATIQEISKQSKIKRTSLYYILEKLNKESVILATKRNKKSLYVATSPKELMKRTRERLAEFENILDELEDRKHVVYHKPRVYFLYGARALNIFGK